ncbi:hypothetical protein KI387_035413, partial [Taxus chinensis]
MERTIQKYKEIHTRNIKHDCNLAQPKDEKLFEKIDNMKRKEYLLQARNKFLATK